MERVPIIVFDDSSKNQILNSLELKKEGSVLVDKDGLVQIDQQLEEVSQKNFGGVLIGSKVIIKNDSSELLRYFVTKSD